MSTNKNFSTETSERYSRALFEVANETNELDKTENDVKNFQLLFKTSQEIRNFIKNHQSLGNCIELYLLILTLIRRGGGPNGPPGFKSLISREPKVGLTSNQAVNLSLSIVLRPMKKNWSVWTMKGPWRALFYQGSPEVCLAGSILGSILGSMKVPEGALSPDRVPQ